MIWVSTHPLLSSSVLHLPLHLKQNKIIVILYRQLLLNKRACAFEANKLEKFVDKSF